MLEQQEVKPRLSYAEFLASQKNGFTIAQIIERFIRAMNGLDGQPPVKTLGQSHRITLRCLQRAPIGSVEALKLDRKDVIAYCQESSKKRRPATVQQYVTYLFGALNYAGAAWDDCDGISGAAITAAKPFLKKHNLIGKSTPRERRPTPEEIVLLLAHFAIENARKHNEIDMVRVANWQLKSARRISETCRIEWADWDREGHTIIVHKMKDPKNRNKSKRVALPDEAQTMLEEMWPLRDPNEPRIFPYRSASCSARYCLAKKALGIVGLRMHDSRRDCGTRLVEDKGFSPEEAILVTGHETTAIFQRTYLCMKPELFKLGPKAQRLEAAMESNKTARLAGMTPEQIRATGDSWGA